jgi:hypothetical protein
MPSVKISREDVEAAIRSEYYFTAQDGARSPYARHNGMHSDDDKELSLVTFCVLVLHSGFKVVGTSIPVNPVEFDAELGRDYAFDKAIEELVPLLGFQRKEQIHQAILAETPEPHTLPIGKSYEPPVRYEPSEHYKPPVKQPWE